MAAVTGLASSTSSGSILSAPPDKDTQRMKSGQALLALVCAFLLLQSCGGGGGGGADATSAPVQFSIDWAERGRTPAGPSSALSAVLTLAKAGASGADFIYTI